MGKNGQFTHFVQASINVILQTKNGGKEIEKAIQWDHSEKRVLQSISYLSHTGVPIQRVQLQYCELMHFPLIGSYFSHPISSYFLNNPCAF